MSHFKATMQHIRFSPGLRPTPRWGSFHRSPDPLAAFKGAYSKGRKGEGKGGENDLTTLSQIPGYATQATASVVKALPEGLPLQLMSLLPVVSWPT